jgi:hypothetical protein
MSRQSVDDILVPVVMRIPEGGNPDTSLDVVQFQFTPGFLPPRSQPGDGDWTDGFWLTQGRQLLAGITIGPGTSWPLPRGTWVIWLKIEDDPTTPIKAVDTVTIT